MTTLHKRLSLCLGWFKDENHTRILLGLLVAALLLRLAAVLIIPMDYRFRQDAVRYTSLAQQLLNQEPYGLEPGVPDALVPPGYPLFIAGIWALTWQSLMAVRLAQALLGVIAVWMTFLIGRESFSSRVGLLGAFILAVYPVWIIWPALFLTEALFTVLVLAFALYLVRSTRAYSAKHAVGCGVAFSLALLTREALYGLPVVLPFACWWARRLWRDTWRCLLLFAVAVLLVLSPWLIRNYITFGHVFFTEGSAYTQYRVLGSGYLSPHMQEVVNNPSAGKSPEYNERYGLTGDMVRVKRLFTEPTTYLRQLGNRLVEYWLHPNGLESLPDNLAIRGTYVALHVILVILACVGIVSGLKRREAATGSLVLLLGYATGLALFFGPPNPRYNLPFLPFVFSFAANGALRLARGLVHGFRNRARRSAG